MTSNRCPHCGRSHPPEARFCPVTGKPLASSRRASSCLAYGLISFVGLLLMGAGLWLFVGDTIFASRVLTPTRNKPTPDVTRITKPDTRQTSTPVMLPTASPRPSATRIPSPTQLPSPTLKPTVTATPFVVPWTACLDASPSYLYVGLVAYVSFDPPLANRVRADPNRRGRVIGEIQPGEIVQILEGPRCADGWVWWKVQSNSTGLTGWTAEGDKNTYWLLPCQTQDSQCYTQ